jgi:hypothetical protein
MISGLASRVFRTLLDRKPEKPYRLCLHFKRIHSGEALFAVRIGLGWRALGLLEGHTIT